MQLEMSGISMGHSHPRPCSGKKTLRRCRNNEAADNVILIDVDSENCDNVVIIDIPESLPKKNQELHMLKKDEKWSFRNVINIDDDETPGNSCPFGANNVSFSAGTSLQRESFHIASNFEDSSDGDCQFIQDSPPPVRLSKCKRTYSGRASTRNHYGLDTDSECDLSDDDYPDCDLVEDFSGEVQAMWEKAFSRRRNGIHNVYSGSKGQDITSQHEDHQNVEARSSVETDVNQDKAFPGDNHRFVPAKATVSVDGRSFNSSMLPGEETACSTNPSCKAVDGSEKSFLPKSSLSPGKDKKGDRPLVPEIPFVNEAKHKEDNSQSNIDACVISDREHLKETDEYKRAMEEEWASRQQALQIQVYIQSSSWRISDKKKKYYVMLI